MEDWGSKGQKLVHSSILQTFMENIGTISLCHQTSVYTVDRQFHYCLTRPLIRFTLSTEAREELQAQSQGVSLSSRRMTGIDWYCFIPSRPFWWMYSFPQSSFWCIAVPRVPGCRQLLVVPSRWLSVAVCSPFPSGCLSPLSKFLDVTLSKPSTAFPLLEEWFVVSAPNCLLLVTDLHLICFSGSFFSAFLSIASFSKQLSNPVGSSFTILGSRPFLSYLECPGSGSPDFFFFS